MPSVCFAPIETFEIAVFKRESIETAVKSERERLLFHGDVIIEQMRHRENTTYSFCSQAIMSIC